MRFLHRIALVLIAAGFAFPATAQAPPKAEKPMRIGVIGAGWLGGTVARAWVAAGHEVMFSSRHPEELAPEVRKLGAKASVGTPAQAAAFGPVVLIAVPYDALPQVGRDLRTALRGKIVLDATNPGAGSALGQEAERTGVGAVSKRLLPGVRLVRAFSAVDATRIETSSRQSSGKLGVPIAGDDAQAVQVAAQLVRDAGSDPVIVGDLAAARQFQRGTPAFRANTTAQELRRILGLAASK